MLPPVELLKARIITRLEALTADELERVLENLPDKRLVGTPVRDLTNLSHDMDIPSEDWDRFRQDIDSAFGQVWEAAGS